MRRISVLLIVLICCSSFDRAHKFYVSVTQIEYVASKQQLQVVSRLFIDDVENVLQARYDSSLLISSKNMKVVKPVISKYFNKKLNIEVNDELVAYNFLGFEIENDLIICYLEVVNVTDFKTITIDNQLLMDQFSEQQNIVHVKKQNTRKSLILEDGNHKAMLNFNH
ncbi:DUF6702 family protein [Aquimarina sp. W85]|uniref:DUF6702 family protein n=1 Tax=Aquimarina rhodophyticola TaxID=3342246 RepID=UPI0036702A9D